VIQPATCAGGGVVPDEQQQALDLQQLQCATYVPYMLICVENMVLHADKPELAYSLMNNIAALLTVQHSWRQQPCPAVLQQLIDQVLPAILQHLLPAVKHGEAVLQGELIRRP